MTENLRQKIEEFQNGNSDSILYILQKFAPLLHRYAALTKDEDGYQELQYQLMSVLKKLDLNGLHSCSDGTLVTYIQHTVRNKCLEMLRKHAKNGISIFFDDLTPYEVRKNSLAQSSQDLYENLILYDLQTLLPPNEYAVIFYVFIESYTVREVAILLGKSRQAINQTKLSALKRLRKKMQEWEIAFPFIVIRKMGWTMPKNMSSPFPYQIVTF